MKVCPVCSESFDDDLRFCEFDGAKLTRKSGRSSDPAARDQSKLWSLLGIGLLLGALVISATTIVFMPKSPPLPPVVRVESTPAPAPPPEVAEVRPSDVAEGTSDSTEPGPSPEAKNKDKDFIPGENNGTSSSPNPKAAARTAADGERSPSTAEPPPAKDPAESKPAAPVATAKDLSAEPSPKTVSTSANPKKDEKRQTAGSNQSEKDSKKKTDDKEKKKGGGFLRVFKKIFGKG